jgi:hypothetical protein
MGIDPLRFAKVDYSSTHNDFDGSYNAPNYANKTALDAFAPPLFRLPHVVIEPSALRAANAYSFE